MQATACHLLIVVVVGAVRIGEVSVGEVWIVVVVGEIVVVKGHPATGGAPGLDVLGKGTGVTRADGRSVPK